MAYKQRNVTLPYQDTKDKKKSVRKERKHIIIEYIYNNKRKRRKKKKTINGCVLLHLCFTDVCFTSCYIAPL